MDKTESEPATDVAGFAKIYPFPIRRLGRLAALRAKLRGSAAPSGEACTIAPLRRAEDVVAGEAGLDAR